MLQRGTLPDVAAVGALQERREAAAVEQQQRLLPARERADDRRRRAPPTRRPRRCRRPSAPTRRSMSSTGGSGRAPIRSGSRSSRSRLLGVRPSSRATAWRCRARDGRLRAAPAPPRRPGRGSAASRRSCSWSRAPRRGRSMPRFGTGAKMAERAPTATRRSPRRSSRQASARSPSESALCSTATSSPNTPRNRLTVCGVSADLRHQHDRAPALPPAPGAPPRGRPASCRCR